MKIFLIVWVVCTILNLYIMFDAYYNAMKVHFPNASVSFFMKEYISFYKSDKMFRVLLNMVLLVMVLGAPLGLLVLILLKIERKI